MWKLNRAATQIARGTLVTVLMTLASCATSRFGVASAQYVPAGDSYEDYGSGGYVGASVDVGVFHETLSPYGDWVYVSHYGRVWRPYHAIVGVDFRPYLTGGHWVYTDYGWSFESDYDWGWAPFHYGRWFLDPYYGWVWLPDTVWAPAWVDWRFGGGYIGWAPLAPAGFSVSIGYYRPAWCFVPTAHFVVHDVYRYALPYDRVHTAFAVTSPIQREVVYSGARWNGGPPPGQVSHAAGQVIQSVPVTPPRPGTVQVVHAGVPAGAPAGQFGAVQSVPRPPAPNGLARPNAGHSIQAPPHGAAQSAVRPPSAALPAPQSNAGAHVQAPPPGAAPGAPSGRSEAHWGQPPSPPRVESAQPHWGRGVQAPPPGAAPSATYGRSEPRWGQPPSPPRMESHSGSDHSAPPPSMGAPPARTQVAPPPAANYGGAPRPVAPPPSGYAQSNQGMHAAPSPPPAPHASGAPPHASGGVMAPPPGHPHH